MDSEARKFQERFSEQILMKLEGAGKHNLQAALALFFGNRALGVVEIQAMLGTFGIGVELMTKAWLSRRSIILCTQNLDDTLRIALCLDPEKINTNTIEHAKKAEATSAIEFIDFQKCISLVQAFGIDLAKESKARLDMLRRARNVAIHGVISERTRESYDKLVFGGLSFLALLEKHEGNEGILE